MWPTIARVSSCNMPTTFALICAIFVLLIGCLDLSLTTTILDSNAALREEDSSSYIYSYPCLMEKDDSDFAVNLRPIGLQVSSSPLHQLLTRIFALFLRDILNYGNIYIFPIEIEGNPDELNYEDRKLRKILDRIGKHERYPNISMMNVGVWTPFIGHALKPKNVHDAGISTNPGRYGWFAPQKQNSSLEDINYKILLNHSNPLYDQFLVDYVTPDLSEYDVFKTPLCDGVRCVTLFAENKADTSFVQSQIIEMEMYVNVVWLGPKFRSEISRMYENYLNNKFNKRFLILHWIPSDVIDSKYNYDKMEMPLCDVIPSLWRSYCKYELTPIMKYFTHSLLQDDRLVGALRLFWVPGHMLNDLFNELVNKSSWTTGITNSNYDNMACSWLRNNIEVANRWISKEPMTITIAGIFPVTQNSRGHQNLVEAVRRAAKAVSNSNILQNYNFRVSENDGACKADMVMKSFLHVYFETEVLGVLGPACSETVEPIAGISRHANLAVISYSAEGASFVDREAYPFFFRTIGSNWQYEDVFISIMKSLHWKRVAALTEDGQKYTEYISHMESTMKNNDLELIVNKKFLNDVSSEAMNKYLLDLKKRHAKIIIADIQSKHASMALCEAYKLGMMAQQGYVWFLPSWLSKDWKRLAAETSNSCSCKELEEAFEGHFSIMYEPFGNNDTLMEENITIKQWIDSYSSSVDSVSMYTAFAYDAVWTYALAADKLLRENKGVMGNFHSHHVASRLVDIIWETDFEGLSGRVRFGQGGSRISNLLVTQWRHNKSVEVGKYIPAIVGIGRSMRTDGGSLVLNRSAIFWLSETRPPGDGTFDCSFAALAEFLNTECENATVAFTAFLCFIAVVIVSLVSFLFWKRRYNKKMKRSAKIMKNFGIDLLSPSRSNINTLDKWEIPKENVVVNRRLGEGAFGTVYGGEAQIGSEGWTAVAVKTLKTGASTEDRLDFLSEAEAMKRFNHKNIVKLLGVCLQSEPIYTIMEFMLYGDLKTYLLARRHMVNDKVSEESDISSKRLTSYALDIARGLSYLAQQKYVHRDLACRNCLVNAQRVVKLGDFGMSRPTYESDYYRFNRKGMMPVRWMAPEALALGMFTPASDVWAFGVVLFEIITFGSFPYQGLTNSQVLEHVKCGNTLQIPVGVKPHLEGLIKACWNGDNKKRPTAFEVVEYISKYSALLTPCLDFPSASVEMAETDSDELDLIPKTRKCSSLKCDSSLSIPPLSTMADTVDRLNNVTDQSINSEQTTELLSQDIDRGSPVPSDTSPLTPDGYFVMAPLLTYSQRIQSNNV